MAADMTTISSYAVGIANTAKKTEAALDNRTLDNFLRSVEKRGFRMAQVAVGNQEDALDILQDTMSKLAQLYGDRTWDDWRPLFYSAKQNFGGCPQ